MAVANTIGGRDMDLRRYECRIASGGAVLVEAGPRDGSLWPRTVPPSLLTTSAGDPQEKLGGNWTRSALATS